MQALHWTPMDTGGGCTALHRMLPRDRYALVTDDSGTYQPHSDDAVLLGFYREGNPADGAKEVSVVALPDLPEAERIVKAVEFLLSLEPEDAPCVLCWQIPTELEECFHAALDAKVIDIDADDCYYIVEADA